MIKKRASSRSNLLAGLSALCLLPALPAHAQAVAAGDPAIAGDGGGATDIVVTAQRREQRLNDVPLSVVAASGSELLTKGIRSTEDLPKLVPGLTVTQTGYGTPVLTLRGIGFFESSLGANSPVPLYLDEISFPNTLMSTGTSLDVQRLEVLKGPQGTLYGQNSTGGAINFVSNKPTDTVKAGFDASLGRFMDTDLQGFLSGPISDTLRARIALRTNQSGDWQKSISRDDSLGATRLTMGRLLLDWDATSRLKFQLNLNGFIDKSDTQALAATRNIPRGVPGPAEANAPLTPPGNNRLADWDPGQQFRRDNWHYMAALNTRFALNDDSEIIALTSYQNFDQNQLVEADGANCECSQIRVLGNIKTFSQEIRLQGEVGGIKYVVGGNYSHDKIFEDNFYNILDSAQAGLAFRSARAFSNQTANTYAAFGNVAYAIADGWNLEGGIRFTKQDRVFSGCLADVGPADGGRFAALFGLPPGSCVTVDTTTGMSGSVTRNTKEDNISWRASVNYKPSDGQLLYVTVAHGYKQGSFPNLAATLAFLFEPAKQESVLSYEAGAKLALFDRKLQLNGAAFYYDYKDKQLRGKFEDPVFSTIERLINVPKSRVIGAELQAVFAPVHGLNISGSVTYADSKILSNTITLAPAGGTINMRGESFELTPKWAASSTISYDAPISSSVNGFVGLDVNYQSRTHGGYSGQALYTIDPYTLLDARIGVRANGDQWRAQVWVKNLTDEYYWTNANYLAEFAYRLTGRPRTYGLSVSYRY